MFSILIISIVVINHLTIQLNASGDGYKKASLESARIANLYNEHLERSALKIDVKAQATTVPPKTTAPPKTTILKLTTTPLPKTTAPPKTTTLKPTTTAKPLIFCPFNPKLACDATNKYQSFDGTCNNLKNPLYGAANTPFKRLMSPVYQDGLNSPRLLASSGTSLPNPRVISTSIFKDLLAFEKRWFLISASFGQFMVHDMTSLAASSGRKNYLI